MSQLTSQLLTNKVWALACQRGCWWLGTVISLNMCCEQSNDDRLKRVFWITMLFTRLGRDRYVWSCLMLISSGIIPLCCIADILARITFVREFSVCLKSSSQIQSKPHYSIGKERSKTKNLERVFFTRCDKMCQIFKVTKVIFYGSLFRSLFLSFPSLFLFFPFSLFLFHTLYISLHLSSCTFFFLEIIIKVLNLN